METRVITIDGHPIAVEVDAVDASTQDRLRKVSPSTEQVTSDRETTSVATSMLEVGVPLRQLIGSVAKPVSDALAGLQPAEWSLEVSLGFKGETGIPCLVKGEANGALKVTIKWIRPK